MDGLPETLVRLGSFEAFRDWWMATPSAYDLMHMADIAGWGAKNGIDIPFVGHVPASEVSIGDGNYRETYVARGLNARQRGLLKGLADHVGDDILAKIYAHEALTPLALLLRGRFPFFLGSEYAPAEADRTRIFPIPHIDAGDTLLPEGVFDAILSSDVLEHVPDIDAVLRESRRILKPGGVMLATFPFNLGGQDSIVKARMENGELKLLCEPEYHGDPVRPEAGALVFSIPGWDILDRARAAGFSAAEMVYDSSALRGCVAGDMSGVMHFRAQA